MLAMLMMQLSAWSCFPHRDVPGSVASSRRLLPLAGAVCLVGWLRYLLAGCVSVRCVRIVAPWAGNNWWTAKRFAVRFGGALAPCIITFIVGSTCFLELTAFAMRLPGRDTELTFRWLSLSENNRHLRSRTDAVASPPTKTLRCFLVFATAAVVLGIQLGKLTKTP